jgi:hypothetical protein
MGRRVSKLIPLHPPLQSRTMGNLTVRERSYVGYISLTTPQATWTPLPFLIIHQQLFIATSAVHQVLPQTRTSQTGSLLHIPLVLSSLLPEASALFSKIARYGPPPAYAV